MFDTILLAGVGGLGKSVLVYWDIIIPHIKYNKMILIEPRDVLVPMKKNWTHNKISITRDNYKEIIDKYNPDLFIDCTIGVNSICLIDYCQYKNILYVNTALEEWKDYPDWDESRDLGTHALVTRHTALDRNKLYGNKPTMIMESGMNPGMISHFAKYGIDWLAAKYQMKEDNYGELSMKLGIRVIQCSEVDTQRISLKLDKDTFINTWSSIGFIEEALDPVQIGWGNHEEYIGGVMADGQHIIAKRGMNTMCKGINPLTGYYEGYLIPHGESTSLRNFLTYKDYSPSVYYVYSPSPISKRSIDNLRQAGYRHQKHDYVVNTNDVIDGDDAVGALFIMDDGRCYWFGTIVNKKDVPKNIWAYTNPTLTQVVSGVLAAIDYIDRYREEGILFPEQIDSHRALAITRKCLGKIYQGEIDGKLSPLIKDLIL